MKTAVKASINLIRHSPLPLQVGERACSTSHDLLSNKLNKALKGEKLADTQLSYVSLESTEASSQSPLVLIHSLFGRKENFKSLGKKYHHLTKRTVIIPDARNHGNSPSCLTPSLKQMSVDLINHTTKMGVNKTCLMGHSMGGQVSMLTALMKPELVDKLVVVSSSPINTPSSLSRWEKFREACYISNTILSSHGQVNRIGLENSVDGANAVEIMLEVDNALKATLEDRSERALFLNNLGKVNIKALLNNPDMGKFPNLQGSIFSGPTLFITGEKQPAWNSDNDVRAIKQLFPNSFFAKIPGAGQWVHTEKEKDFLAATVPFLQSEF